MFLHVLPRFRYVSLVVVLATSLREEETGTGSKSDTRHAAHFVTGPAEDIHARLKKAYGAKEVNWDWFRGKSNLLFAQMTSTSVKKNPSQTKRMETLVELRTEFLCSVFFHQRTDCLYDKGDPTPVRIPATKTSHQCYATALGSVTMLSDLDFTVTCQKIQNNPKGTAIAEVQLAKKLVDDAEKILKTIAGRELSLAKVFDTNVYTNTFSYSTSLLACPCNEVHIGTSVGFALYALARGKRELAKYLHQSCNGTKPDALANYINELTSHASKTKHADELSKHQLINFLSQVPGHLADMSEGKRTEMYFKTLLDAIGQTSEFCSKVPVALMYANEAYWTNGAIDDVVFGKASLNPLEVIESTLMNLGYALEHAVHEFTSPYAGSGKHDDALHKSFVGDGIVKFGKYFQRVEKALEKAKSGFLSYTDSTTRGIFALAQNAMRLKKEGKQLEDGKDSLGLPRKYLEAFEKVAEFQSIAIKGAKGLCGFAWDLQHAAMNIYDHVVRTYMGPCLQHRPSCQV